MNFFEQQDLAHRNTKRLVFLLCLAVISLIAITTLLCGTVFYYMELNTHRYLENAGLWQGIKHSLTWETISAISIGVCGVIFLGSLYKYFQLSGGGRAVAEAMGGRLLDGQNANADEKKILNVVEEMAIASGTPVPPVYILEDDAINAFAAGHTPQDAVIGITRGCIKLLKRDELQGVIAHEFSHIFHGDMKMNMRLIALLNGILLLGLIGEFLVRSTYTRSTFRSDRDKSPGAILGLGIGLIIIGYTGTFFGNLIKSAVSRQREFLADASAVKFTRNPDGISGALKKIGGYAGGSQLENNNATEFSHMYFSDGVRASFSNFMATHPPLQERIKRIEPRWNGEFPNVEIQSAGNNVYIEEGRNSADADQSEYDGSPLEFISPKSASINNTIGLAVTVDQVLQTIGQPTNAHLAYAKQTLNDITDKIRDAAHNPWEAQALMLGLLLDSNTRAQAKQWQLLNRIFPLSQIQSLKPWALQAAALPPRLRLPLLELSLPALKNLSPNQYELFRDAMNTLIRADDHINLMEWSYFRILTHNLEPKKSRTQLVDLAQLQKEACTLLSVIANAGGNSSEAAQLAFDSSKTIIGFNDAILLRETEYSLMDLDLAITRLNAIKPLQKPKLLKAVSQCILADQKITVVEAELFRAIADALDCPIPPMVAND